MREVQIEVGDDEPVFIIRGKDKIAVTIIREYMKECARLGLMAQADEVEKAMQEMMGWQTSNRDSLVWPAHVHRSIDPGRSLYDTPLPVFKEKLVRDQKSVHAARQIMKDSGIFSNEEISTLYADPL